MTRRMKKTDKEECYRLFEQGLSNEEVAGRMQTSVKLMRYYRTEWKADCNPTEDTRTGKEIMYDMLEKGITDEKKTCGSMRGDGKNNSILQNSVSSGKPAEKRVHA